MNEKMEAKLENLKFILTRLDTYIESSQNKSNLYLALNTIILGGVITIISVLDDLNCNQLLNFLLLLIAIASIMSILITLSAINPYMKSSRGKEKSIFFFDDIAECTSRSDYQRLLKDEVDNELIDDMCSQVYSVAKGLRVKYKRLRIVGYIIAGEFIVLAVWIIILLITK